MKEDRRLGLPPMAMLHSFAAAVRHGSFTRAAAEVGLTQSAISRQIAGLEQWLGQALFDRLGRRVKLNQAGQDYAWGDELAPAGAMLANYWQGLFPFANQRLDGWEGTSPVGNFPPNGYGLVDMIGNVWEWSQDWWSDASGSTARGSCCVSENPRGGRLRNSYDPQMPQVRIARKVLKGGSHLCAENYCRRYRPAARHPQMIDSATNHIGFRCVVRG